MIQIRIGYIEKLLPRSQSLSVIQQFYSFRKCKYTQEILVIPGVKSYRIHGSQIVIRYV